MVYSIHVSNGRQCGNHAGVCFFLVGADDDPFDQQMHRALIRFVIAASSQKMRDLQLHGVGQRYLRIAFIPGLKSADGLSIIYCEGMKHRFDQPTEMATQNLDNQHGGRIMTIDIGTFAVLAPLQFFKACVGEETYELAMNSEAGRAHHYTVARAFLSRTDWEKFV